MLIYTSRYKGYGKQKPRQWGPISAVCSAVMRNAEQIYGIDGEDVIIAMPFWECSGSPVDLISGKFSELGSNVSWVNNKILTNGPSAHVDTRLYDFNYGDNGDSLSILFSATVVSYLGSYDRLFIKRDSSAVGGFQLVNYDTLSYFTVKNPTAEVAIKESSGKFFNVGEFSEVIFTHDNTKEAAYRLSAYRAGTKLQTSYAYTTGLGWGTSDYCWLAERTDGSGDGNLLIDKFILLHIALTADQAALFNDLPYQLFAPNPAPLIFDMGASGETIPLPIAMYHYKNAGGL